MTPTGMLSLDLLVDSSSGVDLSLITWKWASNAGVFSAGLRRRNGIIFQYLFTGAASGLDVPAHDELNQCNEFESFNGGTEYQWTCLLALPYWRSYM